MSLINKQDIAFSSSFEIEKVVGVYEGSFNTDTAPTLGGYIAYTSFAHTFTRPVFTKLQTSSDQVNWKDENSSTIYAISYSTATEIFVLHAPSNGLIYYRVIAFWITDYDTTNPLVESTVGSRSDIIFDSRLNYQKIAFQGEFTVAAAPFITTNTITHNLGYKPNVRVYNEPLPGQVWIANYGGGFSNYWLYDLAMVETEVKVYDDRVEIISSGSPSSPASRVWYRIYYDG